MSLEHVILVDKFDRKTGIMEKQEVHQKGLLHRAFSVFIFNSEGKIMLQKRASEKYHSGGLWTNTCCGHPKPGEKTLQAAKRRLYEEMGLHCKLTKVFSFTYFSVLGNNLIEYELDHVFIGTCDEQPSLHPQEAEDWKLADVKSIQNDIVENHNSYSSWFKIAYPQVIQIFDYREAAITNF